MILLWPDHLHLDNRWPTRITVHPLHGLDYQCLTTQTYNNRQQQTSQTGSSLAWLIWDQVPGRRMNMWTHHCLRANYLHHHLHRRLLLWSRSRAKKLQTESHLPPPPHRFSNSSLTIATHSSPILTLGHERNRSGPGITSTVNVINTGATTGSSSLDSNSSIGICSDGGGIFGGAISSARRSRSAVISNQPITSQTLKKSTNAPEVLEGRGGSAHRDSVICGKCGKCKCRACREPRELPSWWFCGNKLEISAKSAMNICTCMCCVKGVFYHYSKGYQQDSVEGMCSDDPCAGCESPHCMKRWACMALLSLCLPCLCIYWPAKCALVCCTACYNGCSSRGCQCATGTNRTTSTSQTRRLIESDGSSA